MQVAMLVSRCLTTLLLIVCSAAVVADEELPEIEFLEYLGLWEGSDADLVIFDPTKEHTITQATQHSNTSYTLYEGQACLGAPTLVMQRGEVIVKGSELKSKKGRAGFLPLEISTR